MVAPEHVHLAEAVLQLLERHAARSQQHGRLGSHVEDRRFRADHCRTTVQAQLDAAVEIVPHVLGAGRARPPRTVGRRRGDGAAARLDQRARHGVGWDSRGHGLEAARGDERHRASARQDEGQGAGPEARRDIARASRHAGGYALERGGARQVDDQRIAPRPLLGFEDSRDRQAGQGVGAEPVHGLGREGHEPARADHLRASADTRVIGLEEYLPEGSLRGKPSLDSLARQASKKK